MDIETLRDFCLSLPYATECFPFDEECLVFEVKGKMFLFTDLSSLETRANVKCNPDLALLLRDRYDYVTPGYHSCKKYWNTIDYGRAHDDEMKRWICHSYFEVVRKFPRRDQPLYFQALCAAYPQYAEEL
ncbi:MAG: MmcQ/YjbR family DNA-binding protein [Porphyromonadaceae bacterium]|nr:MmcQ/YjbR family DNA-binding protein [Porphyromonadaceae bacterium]